jgi:hypothetical protein
MVENCAFSAGDVVCHIPNLSWRSQMSLNKITLKALCSKELSL